MKLTWAPLKDGLRLSAELWLTFSKSELLLFIFNRCLEREETMDVRFSWFPLSDPTDGSQASHALKSCTTPGTYTKSNFGEQEQGFL